uniref:Aminopeptidase n=1 Tax=Caenorhabditis tropicalis TaxID=1561998 RepID=A0A1I7TNP3_9PELO
MSTTSDKKVQWLHAIKAIGKYHLRNFISCAADYEMRRKLFFSFCIFILLNVGYSAPTANQNPEFAESHAEELNIENVEFNHPKILPEHPENFKLDKLAARQRQSLYVTKERLPPNLNAIDYTLWFKPYFPSPNVQYPTEKNFTFDGKATIQVQALVNTDRFILNAFNFNIQSYKVVDLDGNVVPINSISQDDSKQQLSLITNANGVVSGTIYTIEIVYTGLINSYTDGGVYYTSYNDPQGIQHYMIATHMEPFSARKVFPGLDEPSYKATFTITLQFPTAHVALSNMQEGLEETFEDWWSEITFPTTPKMSSYLIAFAVGPYVNSKYVNKHGTLTRAWGWPGTEQYLQFAAENAGECLYQLGEYTGIKFPLAKADQLGMPEFLAGAMENWGLIIYKYQYIAYNPTTMTTRNMEAAAKVMCHELAHQWFGDLVTTAWWDDLFLNEGFADYFMTYIQIPVYPTQGTYLDTLQVLNELQVGLNADVRSDAHPLVYPDGPAFDDITYNKGASMLRMLSDVLGPNVFQKGLMAYLQDRKYSNARDIDLLTTLTATAKENGIKDWCGNDLNVTDFMQPYLHQTNHPLIRYNNNQKTVGIASFTQEPFGSIDNLNSTPWNYTWTIPLKTSTLTDPGPHMLWLPRQQGCSNNQVSDEKNERKIEEPKKRANQYDFTSITSATYGRIIYDDIGFDRVLKSIQQDDINDNLKLTLLADEYYYMLREKNAGRPFGYDRFLNLAVAIFNTPSFISSPSYSVFAQAQPVLEEVAQMYRDTIDAQLITRMYKKLFQNVYNQLPWNDTNLWDTDTFQETFLPFAVRYDIGDVENRTMTMFANVKTACSNSQNGTAWCSPYSTNLRRAIYCGAAKYAPATSDFFFQMLHAYNKEVITNPYFYQEYMALLEGMSCTQSPATLKVLIRLFSTSTLSPSTLFGFLKYNPVASDSLYNYFNANQQQIVASSILNAYLDSMTYNWDTYTRIVQFASLMNSMDLTDSQFQTFTNYLDRINSAFQNRGTYGLKILNWLYDTVVVIGKTPWEKTLKGDVNYPQYSLSLTPNIPGSGSYAWYSNMTFSASVLIKFQLIKPTSVITINAHRLAIEADGINLVSVDEFNNKTVIPLDASSIAKDYDRGVLTIPTANNLILYPQQYFLEFEYSGFIFQNPNEGDASNTYFGGLNHRKGWIFTTDFEGGPGARSLLPCFDEPSYKGQFTVDVMHSTDQIALSNTLETGTTVYDSGWSKTTFGTTENMSSYLLAICVGHFSNLAKVTRLGVLARVWTWSGMEQYGEFALNVTVGTIEFMEEYFDYSFPLQKLDVMALPQYTQDAGAMENWGLIIGEYSLFMFDPDYATTLQIAEVAETTAHEVVHQWFGDTVTLDWWNDIFLNEAFAQYWFANGIDWTFPEQHDYAIDYNRFYMNHIALKYDCLAGYAKPVISDTPPVFGIEPYYKGSALLNLLNNALTPFVFQQGLSSYLTLYGYGNASPQNLWDSLTQAAQRSNKVDWNGQPLDVASFMNAYTLQTSYPIITLSLRGTSTVQATQQSCLSGKALWNIPLFTQTQQSTDFKWFVNYTGGNDATWLRPLPSPFRVDNAGSTSFARINYDDKSWYSIQAQLLSNMSSMSSTTRAMLLDDANFFYESGTWDVNKYLDLTLYLTNEDSLAPWEQAISYFTEILNRFTYQPELNYIHNYVIKMTQNAMNKFQWNTNGIWTNDRIVQLLVNVNNLANNRQTRIVSQTLFSNFVLKCQYSLDGTGRCSGIHPNLRSATYCYGLRQSTNIEDFNAVNTLYSWFTQSAGYLQTDGNNLLMALGCSTNIDLLKGLIRGTLSGDYPPQVLLSISAHDQTGDVLYNYFMDHIVEIQNAPYDFSLYIQALFQNWSTEEQLQLAKDFLTGFDYELLTYTQKQQFRAGVVVVQRNYNWMQLYKAPLISWIQTNFGVPDM